MGKRKVNVWQLAAKQAMRAEENFLFQKCP